MVRVVLKVSILEQGGGELSVCWSVDSALAHWPGGLPKPHGRAVAAKRERPGPGVLLSA